MKKIVNILTLIRIFATFVLPFIWRILNPLYIIIFVIVTLLTDFFDGFLARKFHVQTLFGSILDTVADKVFGIVIILIIALYYPLYYIIVVLEFLIAVVNVVAAVRGATTKSSFLGRAKMWVLGTSTVFAIIAIFQNYLLDINFLKNIISYIIESEDILLPSSVFITVGCELMVITDYVRNILKELKRKTEKIIYQFKDDKELFYVLFDTEYFLSHKDMPISKHLLK